MPLFQRLSEGLARKTTRRGLVGRSAGLAFWALAGTAAGAITRPGGVSAGQGTVCIFPGPPCACDHCQSNGVCAKPCRIVTAWYAAGCWVTRDISCCDCDCPAGTGRQWCGCGSDYHNDETNCPTGNATGG
jgi:hypothetical protein